MARKQTEMGLTVQKYCDKYPNMADLTLARKIYKDKPLLFKDVEAARTRVRYYRGHSGDNHRTSLEDKRNVKPITHDTRNAYCLPESAAEPKHPFILPKACNNILLISDLHIPYHDVEAISAAIKYGVDNKVNTVFINGDVMDFHMLSRFEKNPHARSVKDEFDMTRAVLQKIRDIFPDAAIYWLKGNHCKRYEKWLYAKAPEIFDDEYYQLENRLQLNDLRIKLLDDMQLVKAGKLFISHGHLMIRGVFAPVNAARGLYMQAKVSTIIGHTHSVSEHSEKNLKDELTTCWSMGCLCELRPDYNPFANKYSHGFAHVVVDNKGDFTVKNMRILNGKIV